MATLGLDSVTVEVEFVAGTWTDVSSYVRWDERVKARYGRASEFDDVSASTLDLAFRNEDGRFTPDNPLSPYWPSVVENKRVRVTGVRGLSGYRFFTGYLAAWEPGFPAADATVRSIVSVSAVDVVGQLDRHTLQAEYVEKALGLARAAATWVDVFGFDDAAAATALRNGGAVAGTSTTLGTGTVIPYASSPRRGSFVIQSGDDDLQMPGYITLTPSGTAGPVVRVMPQAFGVQTVDAWVRFPVTTLPAPGIPLRVLDAWQSSTTRVFSLNLVNNSGSVDLQIWDDAGASLGTVTTGVNDATWRKVTLACNAGTPSSLDVLIDDTAQLTAITATDLRTVWRFYWGGACSPLIEGKNSSCTGMDLAGIVVTPGATATGAQYARPTASVASTTRFADFLSYISGYYTGGGSEGSDDRQVWRTATAGRTVLDCLQELARTIGGIVFQTPGGTLKLYLPDAVTSTTAVASVDIELDADAIAAPPTWRRAVDSIPTRATVTSPVGASTVVNAAAEAAGARRDVQVSSCAATLTDAASLGAAALHASPSLRLSRFAVNLVTSVDDLWDALLISGSVAPIVRGYTEATSTGSATVNVALPAGSVAGDLAVLHVLNGQGVAFLGGTWTSDSGFSEAVGSRLLTAADITAGTVSYSSTGVWAGGSRTAILTVVKTGTFNAASPVKKQWDGHNLSTSPTSGPADNLFGFIPADAYSLMVWSAYVTAGTAPLTVHSSTSGRAALQSTWAVSGGALAGLATSTWGSTGSGATNQDISWAWADASTHFVAEGRTQLNGNLDVAVLRPGIRLRVTGLPTTTFGVSYTDARVQGWDLEVGVDELVLTFDTTPADDPVRGVVGDGEYGRAGAVGMTVTGGTALTTTGNGTLVITTSGGNPALTVDSTAYPLGLDIAGERVTIGTAPASSTSPQTVTTTARGVAPTVARAHSSGQPVDIWHAAQAAQ